MNIIICDDEKSTCGELERMLMEYARKNGICFNIEVFFTGDSLADYLDKELVDVLFLDIEIPGLDGIMVGDYIRRKLENESIFREGLEAVSKQDCRLAGSLHGKIKPGVCNNIDRTRKLDTLRMLAAMEESPIRLVERLGELQQIIKEKPQDYSCPFVLSTIHASKGLEYDAVYLLDVIDGILPA